MKYILIIIFILVGATSCTQLTKKTHTEKSKENYQRLLGKNSRGEEKYNGLYNIYHINMTILTPQICSAQSDILAEYFQWDGDQQNEYKTESTKHMTSKTKVFISFFTPNHKHNDLNRGETSVWKVYLKVDGTRYTAKISKDKHNYTHLKTLYPYHSQFNNAYIATFDLPTDKVQSGNPEITLTGSLGGSRLKF